MSDIKEKASFRALEFLLGVYGEDEEKAKEIYEGLLEEAESEPDDSQPFYYLGRFCYSGIGTQESEENAVKYMIKAAEKGHNTAREWLGDYYKKSNPALAVSWYSKSSNDDAQRELALMYAVGEGVPANVDKAIEILEKIVEGGDDSVDTSFLLAFLYDEKQIYVQSFPLWKKLCGSSDLNEKGQAKAELELARCYLLERGTDRDLEKAILWAESALKIATNNSLTDIAETAQKIIDIAMEFKNKNIATSQKKSGGCYVATAVYGSYNCPEVWTLRRIRDNTLSQSWYGRLFIKFYYAVSPTLVKWFGNTRWFKRMWKKPLDKLVKHLNDKGVENTPYEDKTY